MSTKGIHTSMVSLTTAQAEKYLADLEAEMADPKTMRFIQLLDEAVAVKLRKRLGKPLHPKRAGKASKKSK